MSGYHYCTAKWLRWFSATCLACLAVATTVTGGVRVGDTHEEVIAELGKPSGFIEMADVVWLYYERGRVRLQDDRVAEVALVSAEEAARLTAERQREAERQRAVRAAQQAQRQAAGEALLEARIHDPYFLNRPATEQVAFWRDFRARYPGVPADAHYAAALERYQREQEQAWRRREQEQRLQSLEARLARAEEQARRRPVTTHAPYVIHHPPYSIRHVRRVHPRAVGVVHPPGVHVRVGHETRRDGHRQRPPITSPSYLDRTFGPWPTRSPFTTVNRPRPAGTFGSITFSTR